MDFITCFITQQINQTTGSEIPTHFLGRPLGRFSPVASAFCKGKRNATYFIPQHCSAASVTRISLTVRSPITVPLGWHRRPLPLYGVFGGAWLRCFFWRFLATLARGCLTRAYGCPQPWYPPCAHGHRGACPSKASSPAPAVRPGDPGPRQPPGSLGTPKTPTPSNLVFHRLSETTWRY